MKGHQSGRLFRKAFIFLPRLRAEALFLNGDHRPWIWKKNQLPSWLLDCNSNWFTETSYLSARSGRREVLFLIWWPMCEGQPLEYRLLYFLIIIKLTTFPETLKLLIIINYRHYYLNNAFGRTEIAFRSLRRYLAEKSRDQGRITAAFWVQILVKRHLVKPLGNIVSPCWPARLN